MRRLLLFASFFLLMVCAVRGQVRPDQAPIVTNPLGSDAFYSQERGTLLRFRLDTLKSWYQADVVDTIYLSNDTIYAIRGDGATYSMVLPSGGVSSSTLADSTAAVRADFPAGVTDGDKGDITVASGVWSIDNDAVDAAAIAADAVGSSEIAADAVGSSEIATGAVDTDELASTAVTPGSYTNTNLTVDADGRITAASNGSAPASIFKEENSSTAAGDGTTNNYHEGSIGIGDFSGNTLAALLHLHATTQAVIRISDSCSTQACAKAYLEFYQGYTTALLGELGFKTSTDSDFYVSNAISGGDVVIETEGAEKFRVLSTGQFQALAYGDSLFNGTPVEHFGITDSGLVIGDTAVARIWSYTPANANDSFGGDGDFSYDNNYLYLKNGLGWNRIALELLTVDTVSRPDEISGLVGWWRSDTLLYIDAGTTLVSTDGQAVYQWNDISGSGKNFIQATSTDRPSYETAEVNSLPIVRFDGTNDNMAVSGSALTGTGARTIIVVAKPVAADSDALFNLSDGATSTPGERYQITSEYAVRAAAGAVQTFSSAASTSVYEIYTVANGDSEQVQDIEGWVNSTSMTPSGSSTANISTVAGNTTIGAVGGASFWDGDVAEIIVYNKELSTQERTYLWNWLADRYNISL